VSGVTGGALDEDEREAGEEDDASGGGREAEVRCRPADEGEPDEDRESEAAVVDEEAEDLAEDVFEPVDCDLL
jgi:hypothetical protein